MYPLVAIVGSTASGKSELALFLAETFSGEIVNYDSVQIFRYLNIGTAKPSLGERQRVPHHMIDICEPTEVFTAGDYQREARRVWAERVYICERLMKDCSMGPPDPCTGGTGWR